MIGNEILGLVVGKFYPPHIGHMDLIDYAIERCDQLIVLVVEAKNQFISGTTRADWLRQLYPTSNVHIYRIDDIYDDDNSEAWAKYTLELIGDIYNDLVDDHDYDPDKFKLDVVFSSEDYGDTYAAALGCRHDRFAYRTAEMPSGTAIRANPLAHWDWMSPVVRSRFVQKVTIVGAESTGKTTLARNLAKRFDTIWIPEYGRYYAEALATLPAYGDWYSSEFRFIAEQQNKIERQLITRANRLMICDTDAFATSIWYERYMGCDSDALNRLDIDGKKRLYLVPDPDISFVQDGTRDGEHLREWMHGRFIERLEENCYRYRVLTGSYEDRFDQAVAIIQSTYPGLD